MKNMEEIKEEIDALQNIIDGNNDSHFCSIPSDTTRVICARIETLKWALDED